MSSLRVVTSEGTLFPDDLAWSEGFHEWIRLEELIAKSKPSALPLDNFQNSQQAKSSDERTKEDDDPEFLGLPRKTFLASFFNRLLGKRDFASYDDVPPVLYRFGNSKEYGPAPLDRVLTYFRDNEEREMLGRFVDEKTLRAPSYFFDLWFSVARALISAHEKKQRQQQEAKLEADALKKLMPRLEAITEEVRRKLIPDWKPKPPPSSLKVESYIERISEALEQALNYDAAHLNSGVLNTPSQAFYAVKVGFEISEQCMNRFRQLAFETHLKTEGEIDEVACARQAGIQIEKC